MAAEPSSQVLRCKARQPLAGNHADGIAVTTHLLENGALPCSCASDSYFYTVRLPVHSKLYAAVTRCTRLEFAGLVSFAKACAPRPGKRQFLTLGGCSSFDSLELT